MSSIILWTVVLTSLGWLVVCSIAVIIYDAVYPSDTVLEKKLDKSLDQLKKKYWDMGYEEGYRKRSEYPHDISDKEIK